MIQANQAIETMFKELKSIQSEMEETQDPKQLNELTQLSEEIKANIQELANKCEIDYELVSHKLYIAAIKNAVIYNICNHELMKTMYEELKKLNLGPGSFMAGKEHFIKIVKDTKYLQYYDFLKFMFMRDDCACAFDKTNFIKDHKWIMDKTQGTSSLLELLGIDIDILRKKITETKDGDLKALVAIYNCIVTNQCPDQPCDHEHNHDQL